MRIKPVRLTHPHAPRQPAFLMRFGSWLFLLDRFQDSFGLVGVLLDRVYRGVANLICCGATVQGLSR